MVRIWQRKKYEDPSNPKITYADEYPGHGFCGGTLVARRHVITAAHCLYHWKDDIVVSAMNFDEIAVRIGDHNIDDEDEDTELPQRFVNVVHYRNHEKWKQNLPGSSNHENGYDISILELAIDLDLKTYTPACLAKYNDKLANWQSGIAVGWGAIREFPWKNYPEVPYEVSLEIEPRNEAECRNPKNGNKFCQ